MNGAQGNGGGGGGYWGGNAFTLTGASSNGAGSGGSSFVSGLSGCVAISATTYSTTTTNDTVPSTVTMKSDTDANKAQHPSGKVFTDASASSGGGSSTGNGKIVVSYIWQ
jgi:hypothetical protein